MTGYAFPDVLVELVKLQKAGKRDEAHDLFDAHMPLLRYEQQQGVGLAVREYVTMKRGFLASDAQRKPGSVLSAKAREEIDYMLVSFAVGCEVIGRKPQRRSFPTQSAQSGQSYSSALLLQKFRNLCFEPMDKTACLAAERTPSTAV